MCMAFVQVGMEEADGDLLRTCFLPIFMYSFDLELRICSNWKG